MFFGVQCSNLFTQRCPLINILRRKTFSKVFQKLSSCSTIIFVGLVEPSETSESELSTFCVINFPEKPQPAMPSSFNTEVESENLSCAQTQFMVNYFSVQLESKLMMISRNLFFICDNYLYSTL